MKHSKSLALMALIAPLCFLSVGCAGYLEYVDRSVKPNVNSNTVTQYRVDKYKVLGPVSATCTSECILGLIVRGKEGQGLLWEKAREKYGDKVTEIKDISAYYDYTAILSPIYCKVITTYVGTAVRKQ